MRQVSGLHHRHGWRIDVGEDAEAAEVVVASIHEAMHNRLQMTTIHGVIVALLQERAMRDEDAALLEAAQSLQATSVRVHEEFATWMSTIPAGWGAAELQGTFPSYVRHLRRAARIVSDLPGNYPAMHALQGVARSCMQSAALADLLQRTDPMTLRAGMLDHSMRPDARLMRLEQALHSRGWGPLAAWRGDSADLSPERFAEENDPEWTELNQMAYEWCRRLLEESGCRTLPHDGHLPFVRPLAASLDIARGHEDPASSFVALMSVESETLVLRDPLPAVVLPRETPPAEMLAGDLSRRHLFLAIRPRASVLAQYEVHGAPLGDADHLAMLRCQRDDGVVELLDVTHADPREISNAGPVVVSISMSSLADEAVQQRWDPLLGQNQAAVMCDLRPSVNISAWLRDPSRRIRYTIAGVESQVGMIAVFAFQIEEHGARSRLHVAPVSRLYSAGLQLWFSEGPDMSARAERDDELGDEPLFRFVAAHTLLEERTFSFTNGDTT